MPITTRADEKGISHLRRTDKSLPIYIPEIMLMIRANQNMLRAISNICAMKKLTPAIECRTTDIAHTQLDMADNNRKSFVLTLCLSVSNA